MAFHFLNRKILVQRQKKSEKPLTRKAFFHEPILGRNSFALLILNEKSVKVADIFFIKSIQ
jgi:hypothetical protein